jgi:hypothetical protein
MQHSLSIQELSISIGVQQHNPSVLTPDFLKYSAIIPNDWELARQPILSQSGSQVSFKSGVTISAQVNQISFSERISAKTIPETVIAAIARKYAAALPQLNYQAVATTCQGHVPFEPESASKVRDYIFKELLSPNLGQSSQMSPKQASVQLVYQLDDAQMTLKIDEATLIAQKKTINPVILFNGRFARRISTKETNSDRLSLITSMIDKWQQDLENYTNLINRQFLPFMPTNSLVTMTN